MAAWWHDFDWSVRGVTVKETGAFIPFGVSIVWDVVRGLPPIVIESLRNPRRKAQYSIAILPRPPRPWYLIWASIKAGGGIITRDLTKADAVAFFDDQTYSTPPVLMDKDKTCFNFNCTDISKSHVASVFEAVFGYALAVDPSLHAGAMVCKGEANGAHDGQIVTGPLSEEEITTEAVYQRIVDNSDGSDVVDLRCPTVRGQIPLVYIKRRPLARRFDNMNATVILSSPDAHFSIDERRLIAEFCARMGLDWGGLDILRDKESGKIYIVDVNKTDMGPPLALNLADKLRSSRLMGQALRDVVNPQLGTIFPHALQRTGPQ